MSAIIILYMSKIAPKAARGMIVAGCSFAVTAGLLLAACVGYATENLMDTSSCRIPIALQFLWAIILGGGLHMLPESPRVGSIVSTTQENVTLPSVVCSGKLRTAHSIELPGTLVRSTASLLNQKSPKPSQTNLSCRPYGLRVPRAAGNEMETCVELVLVLLVCLFWSNLLLLWPIYSSYICSSFIPKSFC